MREALLFRGKVLHGIPQLLSRPGYMFNTGREPEHRAPRAGYDRRGVESTVRKYRFLTCNSFGFEEVCQLCGLVLYSISGAAARPPWSNSGNSFGGKTEGRIPISKVVNAPATVRQQRSTTLLIRRNANQSRKSQPMPRMRPPPPSVGRPGRA
jgi:hypothetical protein